MASVILMEELRCSICLLAFKDPAMLSCGHNFCRACIHRVLDIQEVSGDYVYSCPECRCTFQLRPALMRNVNLHNVAKRFLRTQPNQAKITGIWCTYCVDFSVAAVKSCLHCEASLCDKHLRVHSKSEEHVLSEPRTSFEKRKCSVHKKTLEYYCIDDAACICVSCSVAGEHRGHWVEMLEDITEQKKFNLRTVLATLSTKRNKTEESVQSLKGHKRKAEDKALEEAERVGAIFSNIKRWLDNHEERIKTEIYRQRNEMLLPFDDLISQLEMRMDELSRKMRHIHELCNITDPLVFLQELDTSDLSDLKEGGAAKNTEEHYEPPYDVDNLDVNVISEKLHTLNDLISDIKRGIYVQNPGNISLDINTAHNNILISDDLKTATKTEEKQNRPETAERFQDNYQVMSSRRFSSGRHYWDVEISGSENWRVGMCYPSMDRRGRQSYTGDNNKSWSLSKKKTWFNNYYSVIHDREEIRLPDNISSKRFRIRLDYEAGQLSFYELCASIRHLHTFTATFTKPLHAVFCVWEGSIKILGGASRYPFRNL